jgi:hypothetical protein
LTSSSKDDAATSDAANARARMAEDFVAELFRQLGYTVARNVRLQGVEIDLVIERNGQRSPVEVSTRASLGKIRTDAARLSAIMESPEAIQNPILVILGQIAPAAKDWAQAQYGLYVWDSDIILEKASPFPSLYQSIRDLIGHTSGAAKPESQYLEINEASDLINKLETHIGNNHLSSSEYEDLCRRTFTFLFDPYLYGFKNQLKTSDGANRYDFICRILPGHSFWDSIRLDFRTKAILFECKNYKDLITADQIYSTERYLFAGALRTVCILISRMGPDDGCVRAAQGAMRESGKLILLLSNRGLIEMLKLKPEKDGPENYLDEKIWDFVISLPR